jgi:hypothetical protein
MNKGREKLEKPGILFPANACGVCDKKCKIRARVEGKF